MKLSCNTDYCRSTGTFEATLHQIADAGFTHIMWGHQWNTDFLYSPHELVEIKRVLKECGIELLDVHGSAGMEKSWLSPIEYQRRAGVELVVNRMQMLCELEGSGVLVMHGPMHFFSIPGREKLCTELNDLLPGRLSAVQKSMDELLPIAEKYGVKIALENMICDDFSIMEKYMLDYPAELVGMCYDSGHANIGVNNMPWLKKYASRLISVHLHDNDGTGDQHQPPGYGTLNWQDLAEILAVSAYTNPLNFEFVMTNTPFMEADKSVAEQSETAIKAFLADAYTRCAEFVRTVENCR